MDTYADHVLCNREVPQHVRIGEAIKNGALQKHAFANFLLEKLMQKVDKLNRGKSQRPCSACKTKPGAHRGSRVDVLCLRPFILEWPEKRWIAIHILMPCAIVEEGYVAPSVVCSG